MYSVEGPLAAGCNAAHKPRPLHVSKTVHIQRMFPRRFVSHVGWDSVGIRCLMDQRGAGPHAKSSHTLDFNDITKTSWQRCPYKLNTWSCCFLIGWIVCLLRSGGRCRAARPRNQVQAFPRLAGPLAARAEGAGPAELAVCSAARRLQHVSEAAQGSGLSNAGRSVPPGERQAGDQRRTALTHSHHRADTAAICCLLGEIWRWKLVGGAAGVEVWPVPVLWNSGTWSPLSAGCHLPALGGKHPQLEGVHVCAGQQDINVHSYMCLVVTCGIAANKQEHKEQKIIFWIVCQRTSVSLDAIKI